MVRPLHVAAPDLPGRGLPEISPAFLGTWGPRFRNSTGRVRRPRSQLSDRGRMPRPPEGKKGDYELRDSKGLNTLAGGTPLCMYRQGGRGAVRARNQAGAHRRRRITAAGGEEEGGGGGWRELGFAGGKERRVNEVRGEGGRASGRDGFPSAATLAQPAADGVAPPRG
jgi:hypothetical protein